MKFVVFILCLIAFAKSQAPETDKAAETERIPIPPLPPVISDFVRVIPADVLRDHPGLCFASTSFTFIGIHRQWQLSPFCGVSTCMVNELGQLFERVEDCGPAPLPHKCTVIKPETENLKFPDCCPKYDCPEGETIKYDTPNHASASETKDTNTSADTPADAPADTPADAAPATF